MTTDKPNAGGPIEFERDGFLVRLYCGPGMTQTRATHADLAAAGYLPASAVQAAEAECARLREKLQVALAALDDIAGTCGHETSSPRVCAGLALANLRNVPAPLADEHGKAPAGCLCIRHNHWTAHEQGCPLADPVASPSAPGEPTGAEHHVAMCTRGCCCLACSVHCDCGARKGAHHDIACNIRKLCTGKIAPPPVDKAEGKGDLGARLIAALKAESGLFGGPAAALAARLAERLEARK